MPLILICFYYVIGIPSNNLFFFTNLLILIISFVGMFIFPLRSYSLFKMVFIFIFIFFGVVPLMNEVNNNIIWGKESEFDTFDKVKANIIILAGMFFFVFGSFLKLNLFDKIVNSLPDIKNINILFFVIFFIISYVILNKWNFDINALLFWSTRGEASYFYNIFDFSKGRFDYLFYSKFIRPMPIILSIIFIYYLKKNNQLFNSEQKIVNLIVLCFLILISILLISPTAIPRWQTATLYIPFVIIFTRFWDKPYMMQTSLIGGLFIVFPFLDKFRFWNGFEKFNFRINWDWLKESHFDSYQNFVRTIEIDFVTYGNQLKGALLFFIPRSIWEEKPIGSGSSLAHKMDYIFAGISMPFIGEGYVNFGLVGSLIFMLFLGILLGNLDRIAWNLKRLKKDCLFLYYYYFLFGLVFFLMRGDLINSIAFTFGMTASFWMLVLVLKFTARIKIF
tara:strand:- start:1772 stop:3118 length:1347 start_codon:yes stop_codon:yes gene_type:complete